MKAIILAAGRGSRLNELTNDRPKSLLPLGLNGTILDLWLSHLKSAGIQEILIVAGYQHDVLMAYLERYRDTFDIQVMRNERWSTANNIVSFWLAKDALLSHDSLIINSDVVCSRQILNLCLAVDGPGMMVDNVNELDEEAMKVMVDHTGRITHIHKTLPIPDSLGEYIGLTKLTPEAAAPIIEAAETLIDSGRTDVYYEDAIAQALPRINLRPIFTDGLPWVEIDDRTDYERAKSVYAEVSGAESAK